MSEKCQTQGVRKAAAEERGIAIDQIVKVMVSAACIRVDAGNIKRKQRTIDIPWSPKPKGVATITRAPGHTDEKLVKSVARAHAWLADLTAGRYACVEDLAAAANISPKVVRQGLRLAFLPPELTMSVLNGEATMALKDIPKTLPLPWAVQREVIG
ncbi:hypothetical protein JQ634_02275 [Bradyrhizobium sp. AUGA SZCCT0240]|uniref:hypothetical protein n=1 Tax=unclassified Bradyrhizobium TaxID=2631580 RepID=UPI001BAD841D|nr:MULTISPECIES: hypothetical protein [unclassified Bradyrhizobium]MBR1196896.1 hypothetical protein [Bradyrhizobium sp. AUGA SZCCT0158]MBR1241880.1 hypothetical protein [Bradyrhizobium sp. AUGA SZCCT0274]MBR1252524.1 hypothetical protein [Bradyrhizobium sp. AUGA SZCCT0240]